MKTVIGYLSACLAAVALTACATSEAVNTNASKPAAAPATGAAGSPASASSATTAGITSGYTLVHKDGSDFYCKKEKVTGSRLRTTDVCLTLAQLEAKQRSVDSLIQDMRDTKEQTSGMDSNGGRTNTAVTQ